jgi:lysophospholipase L1-like esterase
MKRALLIAQLVVVVLIARNWAYVTTYRLYLDHRVGAADGSSAAQQFDIEQSRVVPQIVTRGPDRLSFAIDVRQDSTVRVELRPVHRAAYEIAWRDGDRRRVLAAGAVDAATPIAADYPGGAGIVELVSNDAVSWVDPRIVRGLSVGRHLVALALLAAALAFLPGERGGTRLALRLVAVTVSAIGACVAAEVALRAMGDQAPGGIMTERHDLGEVTRDPRWMDSRRFGRRLRPKVDVINEWRHGDIVRMGYVPPSVSENTLRRFRFQTDSEGFRNPAVRERFEIAALGDSFTDAMTMEAEASWPSQLEKRLGVTVQNYGTAGFGPQQEERVLEDFVARHRPRIVVLAYFAGNDLFDAEAFDEFQRSGVEQRTAPGWRIKDVVSRADTWFVTSALRASIRWIGKPHDPPLAAAARERQGRVAMPGGEPSFDRGMFTVPVNGRAVRFAFMPPYLNTLNFSETDLRARAGWRLTTEAIRGMRDRSRAFGAEFVVMFVPFKSQVYLPLVEREFSRPQRKAAMSFYLDIYERPVDLELMHRNRFAQNDLMRQLCDAEGIPFVDTTAALESRLQAGENVYFPDESHLNEAGEALVAETLAVFLRAPDEVRRDSRTGVGASRLAPPAHRATASDMHVMQTR